MATKTFQELQVWKKAHILVLDVYKLTNDFPSNELYGLTTQIRRASISVPANIVEGYKRNGKAEKVRFYNIAQASLEEVKYLLLLSFDLNYSNNNELYNFADEVSKMLEAYIKGIKLKSF